MLMVQKLLRDGASLEDLREWYGIIATEHPTLPLVILNYSHSNSPKFVKVVDECRALVLERDTWNIVAKAFNRFYSIEELIGLSRYSTPREDGGRYPRKDLFDFSHYSYTEKSDGSLVLIYRYDNKWRVNTRSTFGDGLVPDKSMTWEELTCKALRVSDLQEWGRYNIYYDTTYVGELCSPHNRVVKQYHVPTLNPLAMFIGEKETTPWLQTSKWTLAEVKSYVSDRAQADPTFEGVVLRDLKNNRVKIKSASWLRLHQISSNFTNRRIYDLALHNELDEFENLFPEFTDLTTAPRFALQRLERDVAKLWWDVYKIEDQKELALAIKDHPLAFVVFAARKKHPKGCSPKDLISILREDRFRQKVVSLLINGYEESAIELPNEELYHASDSTWTHCMASDVCYGSDGGRETADEDGDCSIEPGDNG